MRMHNPPHPGLVLREYVGRPSRDHGSGPSADTSRDALARPQQQGRAGISAPLQSQTTCGARGKPCNR
jgi:hypothetical protein